MRSDAIELQESTARINSQAESLNVAGGMTRTSTSEDLNDAGEYFAVEAIALAEKLADTKELIDDIRFDNEQAQLRAYTYPRGAGIATATVNRRRNKPT